MIGGLVFLQKISETPVTKGVNPIIILGKVFDEIATLETGVVDQAAVGDRQIPFGNIEGEVG